MPRHLPCPFHLVVVPPTLDFSGMHIKEGVPCLPGHYDNLVLHIKDYPFPVIVFSDAKVILPHHVLHAVCIAHMDYDQRMILLDFIRTRKGRKVLDATLAVNHWFATLQSKQTQQIKLNEKTCTFPSLN